MGCIHDFTNSQLINELRPYVCACYLYALIPPFIYLNQQVSGPYELILWESMKK